MNKLRRTLQHCSKVKSRHETTHIHIKWLYFLQIHLAHVVLVTLKHRKTAGMDEVCSSQLIRSTKKYCLFNLE